MKRRIDTINLEQSELELLESGPNQFLTFRATPCENPIKPPAPWAIVVRITPGSLAAVHNWMELFERLNPAPRLISLEPRGLKLGHSLDDKLRAHASSRLSDSVSPSSIRQLLERIALMDDGCEELRPCRALHGETRSFVSYSQDLFPMFDELQRVAAHDVTVLLVGETGTGKTYLSQLLHELSPRRNARFLPLACGTIPPDLVESDLFGHVRGAFTGALADKEGKFSAAGEGTLLLDEIDVLGLEQQAKLLRVIESGEYEPVGCTKTQKSLARLVVASNLELEPLVEDQLFRQDLFYRLNVLSFKLPALRERQADLRPLARLFVERFAVHHGVNIERVENDFYSTIQSYRWPGNIREMENAIRRAIILSRNGVVSSSSLPPGVQNGWIDSEFESKKNSEFETSSLGQRLESTERDIIALALQRHGYQRTAAARSLGISRVTLYNKMRKYGIPTQKSQQVAVQRPNRPRRNPQIA